MTDFFDLTGLVAFVTGAATGIGEAIAVRLSRAGASVAAADIRYNEVREAAAGMRCAFPVRIDVTDPESVRAAVSEATARFGRVDILVNDAGIAGRAAPVWQQTFEEWQRVVAVNLYGTFHCCQAVIPPMRERRFGRIVNIASIAGKEGNPNMTAYSASKAGVIGFTKSLAKEVATDGICVNAVSPAVVRTKILNQLTPAQIEYMVERIPMRRTGTPEEIAAVVHFLASRECSFVTGQCYDASGGRATY